MLGSYDSLSDFLKDKGLKLTSQRKKIAEVFFSSGRHVSTEELYGMVKKRYPGIGYTTVFRTLKLLREAELAREVDLGDKIIRFEQKISHKHHDHLICLECRRCIEAVDPEIERLQEKLARRFSFAPSSHKMEIFGICKDCRRKKKTS